LASELPLERPGRRLPVVLKIEQSLRHCFAAGTVIRGENLALHDGEVNLDLIQPTGMNGRVDGHQFRIAIPQALHGAGSTMGGTVVDDPEDAAGVVVRRAGHDLLDQAIKRRDAVFGLAAAEDSGVMYVERGDVGPGTATKILMLDMHDCARATSLRRVLAAPRLNAGLLICGNDELIIYQADAFPIAGIQNQEAASFVGKVGITREDPTPVIPGADGVLMQPAPNGTATDRSHQASLANLTRQIVGAPSGQGEVVGRRQFASPGFNPDHEIWSEKSGGDPDALAPPVP